MCYWHRPSKLYGYDLTVPNWLALKEKFKSLLVGLECDEAVTGMVLGVDTVFALAVLEPKSEGGNIKLHCAIPCMNYSCKLLNMSVRQYKDILSKADIVTLVSDSEYKPYLLQKRNEYMVDLADKVIAVWDGTCGGTANCVRYAQSVGKEIIQLPF